MQVTRVGHSCKISPRLSSLVLPGQAEEREQTHRRLILKVLVHAPVFATFIEFFVCFLGHTIVCMYECADLFVRGSFFLSFLLSFVVAVVCLFLFIFLILCFCFFVFSSSFLP